MSLQELQRPEDYQSERSHAFPSLSALIWFQRAHRAELVAAGALVPVNRRQLIRPAAYDAVVLAVGERAARGLREAA